MKFLVTLLMCSCVHCPSPGFIDESILGFLFGLLGLWRTFMTFLYDNAKAKRASLCELTKKRWEFHSILFLFFCFAERVLKMLAKLWVPLMMHALMGNFMICPTENSAIQSLWHWCRIQMSIETFQALA